MDIMITIKSVVLKTIPKSEEEIIKVQNRIGAVRIERIR